ncbi:MAG: hypothetical protein CTR55_22045 [Pseudomonas sp.]|nr:MAG: hypothetical protein CTR55_22045 [Pseudomonas sp.]
MNGAEVQLLKALRTSSFNNASVADRLVGLAAALPEMSSELRAMASQLEQDADTLAVFAQEIHEGRIVRSP